MDNSKLKALEGDSYRACMRLLRDSCPSVTKLGNAIALPVAVTCIEECH